MKMIINFINNDSFLTVLSSFLDNPEPDRWTFCSKENPVSDEREPPQTIREPQVDIWSVNLDDYSFIPALAGILSDSERHAMAKYADQKHRDRYGKVHAFQKLLLSKYLAVAPRRLRVRHSVGGKPYAPCRTVHFNLAHTDCFAVFAFSRHALVGVDVEPVQQVPEATQIAARWFSEEETRWISSSIRPEQAFSRCWVCREAIGKASGIGLAHALMKDVLTSSQGELRSRHNLLLSEWEPWPDFRAAVAGIPVFHNTEQSLVGSLHDW